MYIRTMSYMVRIVFDMKPLFELLTKNNVPTPQNLTNLCNSFNCVYIFIYIHN